MTITLPDDTRRRIDAALQAYVADEFDEELGELRTRRLFEFMVGLIGAAAYNQAIADAQAYLQGKFLDLEGDLHERIEFEPPGTK